MLARLLILVLCYVVDDDDDDDVVVDDDVVDLMAGMAGFNTGPLMLGGGGAKPNRGAKSRGGYSQYAAYYPQNWPDHRMGGGFYGHPTGYGLPIPMMGRHMGMDPNNMDYLADQFQGMRSESE